MKILKNAKNISIFLSAFVLSGIVTVIFLKNTGIFTGRKQISAEKGAAAKPKPKMKMVKGGVMVSTVFFKNITVTMPPRTKADKNIDIFLAFFKIFI